MNSKLQSSVYVIYSMRFMELQVEFDEIRKVIGVTFKEKNAKYKKVVNDPSYVPDKVIKRIVG